MLFQRMLMLPSAWSRPRGPSSLSIGALQDSRLESTTNLQQLSQAAILQKYQELFACLAIQLQLLRHGPGLTISLILCTQNVPLFTGMLEREWKKVSSLRLERTWQHWKRITKKLVWTQLKERKMKEKSTKEDTHKKRNMHNRFIYNKIYSLKLSALHII